MNVYWNTINYQIKNNYINLKSIVYFVYTHIVYFLIKNMKDIIIPGELVLPLIVIWIILVVSIRKYLRNRKAKKLKYEWTWVLKKTEVSAVGERYVSWDDDSSWYYVYRLESKDEVGNSYCSREFKNANHGWRTAVQMKKKYDGVVYDLADKDNAIRQVNDNIQRLEMELQGNPWFFKKRSLKRDIEAMKKYIDIANEWPTTPYLVVNWHKVSVWDPIDVYVNPEKPSQYYFDLDFTKEK